jgi:hypothetical protein
LADQYADADKLVYLSNPPVATKAATDSKVPFAPRVA